MTQAQAPALLARGPWDAEQVRAVWLDEAFVPEDAKVDAADAAIAALRAAVRVGDETPEARPVIAGRIA
jgi:hypothetical protein